jgi:hypothetical protein
LTNQDPALLAMTGTERRFRIGDLDNEMRMHPPNRLSGGSDVR